MDGQMRILELIEAGEISAEEGARRLEALTESAEAPESSAAPAAPVSRPTMVEWLWQIVFWTGVALMAVGGVLVASVYTERLVTGWLAWGWIFFLLGVVVLLVGWWLQRAPWLSVRIRPSDGPKINIALPLPLTLIAWGLRIARPFVPQLDETGADEVLLALRDEMKKGQPFLVEVDEGEGGEQVQVYIGS
jgi:MFS family permease